MFSIAFIIFCRNRELRIDNTNCPEPMIYFKSIKFGYYLILVKSTKHICKVEKTKETRDYRIIKFANNA